MIERMVKVDVLSKVNCPLCDDALILMEQLQKELSFQLNMVDIYKDDSLLERYQLMIPVVMINEEEVDFGQISKEKVKEYLIGKMKK